MKALGIDIGGSAMKGAPVDTRTGRLLAPPHRIPIHRGLPPKDGAKVVAAIAEHFSWSGPIGVGFPGAIEGGHIRTSANLHSGFVDADGALGSERLHDADEQAAVAAANMQHVQEHFPK